MKYQAHGNDSVIAVTAVPTGVISSTCVLNPTVFDVVEPKVTISHLSGSKRPGGYSKIDLDLERARSLSVVVVSALAVQEQTFTLADVAEKTGVSAHALRYYERIGLLDVGRQASGQRRFTGHEIARYGGSSAP